MTGQQCQGSDTKAVMNLQLGQPATPGQLCQGMKKVFKPNNFVQFLNQENKDLYCWTYGFKKFHGLNQDCHTKNQNPTY